MARLGFSLPSLTYLEPIPAAWYSQTPLAQIAKWFPNPGWRTSMQSHIPGREQQARTRQYRKPPSIRPCKPRGTHDSNLRASCPGDWRIPVPARWTIARDAASAGSPAPRAFMKDAARPADASSGRRGRGRRGRRFRKSGASAPGSADERPLLRLRIEMRRLLHHGGGIGANEENEGSMPASTAFRARAAQALARRPSGYDMLHGHRRRRPGIRSLSGTQRRA